MISSRHDGGCPARIYRRASMENSIRDVRSGGRTRNDNQHCSFDNVGKIFLYTKREKFLTNDISHSILYKWLTEDRPRYRGLVKWYDRGLQNLWWEFDSLIPCLKSTVFTVLFCLTGNFVPVKQKALRAGCTRRNEVCYRFAVLRRRAKCSSPSRLMGGGVEAGLPTLLMPF